MGVCDLMKAILCTYCNICFWESKKKKKTGLRMIQKCFTPNKYHLRMHLLLRLPPNDGQKMQSHGKKTRQLALYDYVLVY